MEKQYGNMPKLGFGLMRLPMNGGDVDIDQTKQMVDMFLEAGFTYFDTAYGYLEGKSEAAVKEALVNRYPRDRFLLATKLPAWDGVIPSIAAMSFTFIPSIYRAWTRRACVGCKEERAS